MIEITFQEFHNQEYNDVDEVDPPDYQFYVVKNGLGEVLYVGISNVDIWDRWFGGFGHMLWDGNVIYGNSSIGEKIADHMPESLHWMIQLWTPEDCRQFCADLIPRTRKGPRIHDLEAFMVQKLRPAYNIHYNSNPGTIPRR